MPEYLVQPFRGNAPSVPDGIGGDDQEKFAQQWREQPGAVVPFPIEGLKRAEKIDGGGQRSGFDAMTADLRRIWGELQGQLSSSPRTPSPSAGSAATSQPSPDPARHSASAASGPAPQGASRNQTLVFGLILVIVGLGILGSNVGIINWAVVWPAALITLGVVILVRNLERKP